MHPREVYGFMVQAIIPRPVAWVLSDNGTGNYNLAPFSFFNGVTSRPATLSISIGKKRDGSKKDTWRNIEDRSHFVVHIAGADMAGLLSQTAASLAFGESEVDANHVPLTHPFGWPLPRIAPAKIAMLCQRHQIVEVGEGPQGLILGRITHAFVEHVLVGQDNDGSMTLSAAGLNPLARLGGDDFAAIGTPFSVSRPD